MIVERPEVLIALIKRTPRPAGRKECVKVPGHEGKVVEYESGDPLIDVRQIDLRLHKGGELLAGRTLKVAELEDRDRRVRIPALDAGRRLDQPPHVLYLPLHDAQDRLSRGRAQATPNGGPPQSSGSDHGRCTQHPIERLEISAFSFGHNSLHCSMYGHTMAQHH